LTSTPKVSLLIDCHASQKGVLEARDTRKGVSCGSHHVAVGVGVHHWRRRAAECSQIRHQPVVGSPQLIQLGIADGLHVLHAAAQFGALPLGSLQLVDALATVAL
jgi:hypothetical protein